MPQKHSYIPSPEYIANLNFNHIETYSLQRGSEFEKDEESGFDEIDRLRGREKEKNDLTPAEKSQLEQLSKLYEGIPLLINEEGEFHYSAEKTGTFKNGEAIVEKLKSILKTPVKEIPYWMCRTVYRDAIVFYDSENQIVSTLNVCLSCDRMGINTFQHINADFETYRQMREFFIGIGHEVE